MSGDSEVLRSFLVSLGYVIKHDQQKNFENSLDKTTKVAERTGFAIAGIAIAAQAMVKSYANSMESLYYASQRTGSTIQGIQALQSGAERVGVSAETALGQLEAMSEALNLNPGKRALLESLTGGKTRGMTNEKAMIELIRELKTLPDNIGFGYAQMFGIGDYKSYKNMTNNLRDMEDGIRKREQLNKNLGVNPDKDKELWREYANDLKDISDTISVIGLKLATNILVPFKEISKELKQDLNTIFKIPGFKESEKKWEDKSWLEKMIYSWKNRDKNIDPFIKGETDSHGNKLNLSSPKKNTSNSGKDKFQYLFDLEEKYGIQKGTLAGMWYKESRMGNPNFMLSPAGAEGHFGFKPGTAKEFGLKNPNDFYESADAAARKLKGQLRHYNNNLKMALSAYNDGEGNLSKKGYLGVPNETKDYRETIPRIADLVVNQKVDIHLSSNHDARAVAKEISNTLRRENSEAIRNMRAKLK